MKRHTRITGRNRDHVLYGWLTSRGYWKFAWPEPIPCASEAQAVVGVRKWEREGVIIGSLTDGRQAKRDVGQLSFA